MNRSLNIGTYFGIPVKIHWTFSFTILLVIYLGIANGMGVRGTLTLGALFMTLFFCVILHEYGHALTARRYGIQTKDIIISPIGGIARLEDLPERPIHEVLVAIAGPLVNVVIAMLLTFVLTIVIGEPIIPEMVSEHYKEPADFLRLAILANMGLFLFNLVPAFPMDGGRILRALLAMKLGRAKGTQIAAFIGRILAIGFVFIGVFNNELILGLVGVFIFMMAGMENRDVQVKSRLKGAVAEQIMRKDWTKIHLSDQMSKMIDIYNRGGERSFIVYDSLGYIAGGIPELFVKDAIKNGDEDTMAMDRLSKSLAYASEKTPLLNIYNMFATQKAAIILIQSEEEILGIIDRDILSRFMESRK